MTSRLDYSKWSAPIPNPKKSEIHGLPAVNARIEELREMRLLSTDPLEQQQIASEMGYLLIPYIEE